MEEMPLKGEFLWPSTAITSTGQTAQSGLTGTKYGLMFKSELSIHEQKMNLKKSKYYISIHG